MPPLQLQNGQVPADWGQRVQVVQQQLQNPAYLQPIYGQQVLMPGNLIQQGFGQQPQIQVITASKPFQGGQLTPQMLTTAQGKSVLGNGATGFGGTYTLPTSQPQTLLFSPVNVLGSQQSQQQQQNLLPMTTTTNQNNGVMTTKTNQQDMQKTFTTQGQKIVQKTVNAAGQTISNPANGQQNQSIQVSQSATLPAQLINQIQQNGAQQMQFAPWLQAGSFPLWTTNGLPQQFQNSIFIRPDGTQGMFIHNAQPGTQAIQAQAQPAQQQQQQAQAQPTQQVQSSQAQIQQTNQPQAVQIQQSPQQVNVSQPQQAAPVQTTTMIGQQTPAKQRLTNESVSKQQTPRTLTILPQGANQNLRPNQASSVSTQTNQNQVLVGQNKAKFQKKPQAVRPAVQNVKTDAGNQTKLLTNGQALQQIATTAGNK